MARTNSHTNTHGHELGEAELSQREIAELELELKRVRSEADASRWEARAAELELLLQRAGAHRILSWDTLAAAAARRQSTVNSPSRDAPAPVSQSPSAHLPRARSSSSTISGSPMPVRYPVTPAAPPQQFPDPLADDNRPPQKQPESKPPPKKHSRKPAHAKQHTATRLPKKVPLPVEPPAAGRAEPAAGRAVPAAQPPATVAVAHADGPKTQRKSRRRPAGWLASLGVHLALLLILAVATLSVHTPQDQVALQASAASASEPESLQMMQLQSLPETSEAQTTPAPEVPTKIDPLGEIPMSPAIPPTPDGTAASHAIPWALAEAFDSTQMQSALTADAKATTRFCGIEGGGNHFVYVVDSSQSMKNGRFESARTELLQSIDALAPEQRFYIIFYDTHVERMCIAHPSEPEEHSVLASDANKRAARRWAMSVTLERGAPPDEALKFALQLRPDVIFLLSDGEFPQRIEDLMAQRNRISNLFGEDRPISILHTIGYHSRDGETRMRRLAAANGGEYHYIAGP